MLYLISSFALCLIFEKRVHSINLVQPTITRTNATQLDTSPALFGLSIDEVGDGNAPVRVFHVDSLLCDKKPDAFTFPETQENIAIMVSRGGCSFQQKAHNIVDWYQAKNPKIMYAFVYDLPNVDNSPDMPLLRMDSVTDTMDKIPLSLFFISYESAISFIDLMRSGFERDDPLSESLLVTIEAGKGFSELSPRGMAFALLVEITASMVITIVSLMITSAILIWCWGDTFSIEISSYGIIVSHVLNDDDTIDPLKLFTEEQVLGLREVEYCQDCEDEDEENPSLQHCHNNSTCSICIEDFELGEALRVIPCGHQYHTDCIMPWLTARAANCPMCKESFDEEDKKTC